MSSYTRRSKIAYSRAEDGLKATKVRLAPAAFQSLADIRAALEPHGSLLPSMGLAATLGLVLLAKHTKKNPRAVAAQIAVLSGSPARLAAGLVKLPGDASNSVAQRAPARSARDTILALASADALTAE